MEKSVYAGLDCTEPWYENLLTGNLQIQRNPGMKNGQSWAKSLLKKTSGAQTRTQRERIGVETMEAVLTKCKLLYIIYNFMIYIM
jgi:hypothetical protein